MLIHLLMILWIFVSLFLILIILLQRGKGGGLAGALGGAGGSSAFGTKAGDVFTKITVGVFGAWLLIAMILVWSLKTPEKFQGAAAGKGAKGAAGTTDAGTGTGGTTGTGTGGANDAGKGTGQSDDAERLRKAAEAALQPEGATKDAGGKPAPVDANPKTGLGRVEPAKPGPATKADAPKSGGVDTNAKKIDAPKAGTTPTPPTNTTPPATNPGNAPKQDATKSGNQTPPAKGDAKTPTPDAPKKDGGPIKAPGQQ